MSELQASREHPLIDSDPSFRRVVTYMRPSDYGVWAAATAAFPAIFILMEKLEPANGVRFTKPSGSFLRISTFLGFGCGFLFAYSLSTNRFWGITENSREMAFYQTEVKNNIKLGLPPQGKTELSPWMKDVAVRNSTNSQLGLHIAPIFNFTNHGLGRYAEVKLDDDEK
ncbi:uncharacterized protein ASCRUDRAFT_67634 [Ascoidea rubescens DSM 1968]|uniref:Uncharacterized protein n=1 Tax=Ascoidea rubescens DSM 1968 TaxID=1344418 RepID=A0A1D2VPJ4_9ASCO|nr:hypothetical protein ASCRUDRAFT_67634 [Ascoidea rubescens DSM 1968]ODV63542.1 hypothetical protein ASCRUDRAFT_67634 [Ascoidea rubescens DSM 1968]